ncbi:MAG: cobalamin-dependent protein [Holophagales bacterium]|nr:cobalamin-dependent protein [Holophagales bacterium]
MSEKDLYLAAILAGDRQAAIDVALGVVQRGGAVGDLYVEVLQESLYEVGRLWESNQISVAVEHLATGITQVVLARLYEHLPRSTASRGRIVLTGIEGELHQVGGHMVADTLESDGWEVRFLGAGVPVPEILDAIGEHHPEVLGISCTMLQNLPKAASLIGSVRATFRESSPWIIVGGGAFRTEPGKVVEIGADGWAPDLRSVAGVVRSLSRTAGRPGEALEH